jgi:predicted nucleotidyltransferase
MLTGILLLVASALGYTMCVRKGVAAGWTRMSAGGQQQSTSMEIVVPPVQDLTADQVTALRRLCAWGSVALAVIFGSRARDEATATSDLDLLVLPSAALAFDVLGFEAAAQQIAGRVQVDLTVLHPALSSALAWEALREAKVLWEETQGAYDRARATWHARFLEDAPRRRDQARQLSRRFLCR